MNDNKRAGKGEGAKSETITLGDFFETTVSRVNHWVWSRPKRKTSKPTRLLWVLTRILFIVVGESKKDRLTLRASSLTFTVVLSLVPTLALGTAVLKGLGAGDQMKEAAYRIIDQMEQGGGKISAPPLSSSEGTPLSATGEPSPTEGGATLASHLKKATDTIFSYVEKTNFATLGAFGVAGLVFTVLSVLGSIETSMNAIWQADSGRPFGRKLIDYLSLMVLLPVTVNLTLATGTILQSPKLFAHIQKVIPIFWLQSLLLTLLPIIIVVCTFTILYRFLPNTRVSLFPALAGGLAGGAGWFILQAVYIKLQIGVARYWL
ncbi:MAG: YihY/virulence factor BrkB family protein [Deltaproteobacteria bacterium]